MWGMLWHMAVCLAVACGGRPALAPSKLAADGGDAVHGGDSVPRSDAVHLEAAANRFLRLQK
jgi:hypothetical protein